MFFWTNRQHWDAILISFKQKPGYNWNGGGHATLLGFDNRRKRQWFYDPAEHKRLLPLGSSTSFSPTETRLVVRLQSADFIMRRHSLVDGYSHQLLRRLEAVPNHVVCIETNRSLSLQGVLEIKVTRHGGLLGPQHGCCTTACLLFAVLALRLGIPNFYMLARALRRWILDVYHERGVHLMVDGYLALLEEGWWTFLVFAVPSLSMAV